MTIQLSTTLRNNRLDQIETTLGTTARLLIRSGAPPANVAAGRTGTILATIALPTDWMAAASNGSKTIQGTWTDSAADNAGTAGHFEIDTGGGTPVVHLQGTITATGGGGDMELDNTVFAAGQAFSVTAFTLNEPNA